jgi:N-acyl homoserine lactone hydrolase
MMRTWRIKPIVRGEVLAEKSEILAHQDPGTKLWVPSMVWYLTDGDRHVLVDTGFADPSPAKGSVAGYSVRSSCPLETTLRNEECPTRLVTAVIFTHLHWDHCENLHLFPEARLLVQREEVRYAVAPLPFDAEAYNSPCVGGTPGWLGRRVSFLDGDIEIFPGLRVLSTPGHTPGHQSVLVDTRFGTYGIAGDLLPMYVNAEYGGPGAFFPPACFDYGSWHQSFHRLAGACDMLLPSHEPSLPTDWIPPSERPTHRGTRG